MFLCLFLLRYWVIHSITLPALFLTGWLFVATGLGDVSTVMANPSVAARGILWLFTAPQLASHRPTSTYGMSSTEAVVYSLILLVTLGVLFSAIVFRDPPRV